MATYKKRKRSKNEESLFQELLKIFPGAESDYFVEDVRLAGKHLVFVDVFIPSLKLVVEYDGEYWHRKRARADLRKTKQLLKKGYSVARVREVNGDNAMPFLDLEHGSFLQLHFSPESESYSAIAEKIYEFFPR